MRNRNNQRELINEGSETYIKIFEDPYIIETINVTQILLCGIDDNIRIFVRKDLLDHMMSYIEAKYLLNKPLRDRINHTIIRVIESKISEQTAQALLRLFIYQRLQVRVFRYTNKPAIIIDDGITHMVTMDKFSQHLKRIKSAIDRNPEFQKARSRQIHKLAIKKDADLKISTIEKYFPKEGIPPSEPLESFEKRRKLLDTQLKEEIQVIIDNHAKPLPAKDPYIAVHTGMDIIILLTAYLLLSQAPIGENAVNIMTGMIALYHINNMYRMFTHKFKIEDIDAIRADLHIIKQIATDTTIANELYRLKFAIAKGKAGKSEEPIIKNVAERTNEIYRVPQKDNIIDKEIISPQSQQTRDTASFTSESPHDSMMSARRFLMEYGLTPSQINELKKAQKQPVTKANKRTWSLFPKPVEPEYTWLDGQVTKAMVTQIENGTNAYFIFDTKLVMRQMKAFGAKDSDIDLLISRFVRIAEAPMFCGKRGEHGLKSIPNKNAIVKYNKRDYNGIMTHEMKVAGVDRVVCFKLLSDDKKASLYIGCWYIGGIHSASELRNYLAANPELNLTIISRPTAEIEEGKVVGESKTVKERDEFGATIPSATTI